MTGRRCLGAALAVLLAAPALGQELETLEQLEQLEEAVEDVDPLATSLRDFRLDLRAPSDFEHVYRVPGREDLLMRVDGGLYAVFGRSRYMKSRRGPIPLIPTDTVFFIGRPESADMEALGSAPIPITEYGDLPREGVAGAARLEHAPLDLRSRTLLTSRIDRRLGEDGKPPVDPDADPAADPAADRGWLAGAGPVEPAGTTPTAGGPAILTDAAYRSSRLHGLMRRAAEAAQTAYAARGPSPSSSSK